MPGCWKMRKGGYSLGAVKSSAVGVSPWVTGNWIPTLAPAWASAYFCRKDWSKDATIGPIR